MSHDNFAFILASLINMLVLELMDLLCIIVKSHEWRVIRVTKIQSSSLSFCHCERFNSYAMAKSRVCYSILHTGGATNVGENCKA